MFSVDMEAGNGAGVAVSAMASFTWRRNSSLDMVGIM